jgi:hypothetical protein
MRDNLILTDVDGVLLLWIHTFDYWMARHGYKKTGVEDYDIAAVYDITSTHARQLMASFNESAAIGSLPPFRDAKKYVGKLHDEFGAVLHCITAVSSDPYVKKLRLENLALVFGPTVVERLDCVGSCADKHPILAQYADSGLLWVEDRGENAIMGRDLGLNAVLIDHVYNRLPEFDHGIQRVKNWRQIYDTFAA